MPKEPTIVELDMDDLSELLRRAESKEFDDRDYKNTRMVVQSYVELVSLLREKDISMRRLRKLLFGAKTEKTADVLAGVGDAESSPSSEEPSDDEPSDEEPLDEPSDESSGDGSESQGPSSGSSRKGHGRNGADAYTGAEQVEVSHASLRPGDPCPACHRGTLYETGRPRVLVRLTGQAPIGAKVIRLQQLRCNLCGELYTANAPEGG